MDEEDRQGVARAAGQIKHTANHGGAERIAAMAEELEKLDDSDEEFITCVESVV